MLLRFSVENWMSFKDEITLDMIGTREEQHSNHIARIMKYKLKVLPVAVIYGANASGKSNLTKALRFAKSFVMNAPKADMPIPVRPFLLNKQASKRPTRFIFEILKDGVVYKYEFSVTASRVVHEELVRIDSMKDVVLFRREPESFFLSENIKEKDNQQFAFRGTQDNQLYLTNSVSQKLDEFRPIFDWFDNDLFIIHPSTYYGRLLDMADQTHPRASLMTERLRDLDCGIQSIRDVIVPPDSLFPESILETFAQGLQEGSAFPLSKVGGEDGDFLRIEKGKPAIHRLTPIHHDEKGDEVAFRYSDESDGTLRLLDLLPAFLLLEEKKLSTVFVIDELDRSLHSNLTRDLLEHFLKGRVDTSRAQLIFTTHDTQLMTQDLFRRDEIWITERDSSGASKLFALSEFKDVRKDKDIRKSYLQGRMGGIPRIRTSNEACEEKVEAR